MFGDMSIIKVFQSSPTMVVLLVCSIVTLGFTVERLLYFTSSAVDIRRFMNELASHIKSGNPRAALDQCQRLNKPVARVMAQAVTSMGRSHEEQVQRIDTAIELEQVEMERHIGVLGIIRAFADIARTGSGGGAVVAMGVSEALLTTAAGIIVAVIATVFFNVFVRRIRARVAQLEDARETWLAVVSQYQRRRAAGAQTATHRVAVEQPAPETVGS